MSDFEYYQEGMERVRREIGNKGEGDALHSFLDWVDKEMKAWLCPPEVHGN